MTFHFRNYLFLLFCVCFLSACNKESTKSGAPAVFDSAESAKPVTITEKEHHIFLRPKAGDIFRYRIIQKSLSSAISTGAVTANESATAEDQYYVKQTIRTIRPDS